MKFNLKKKTFIILKYLLCLKDKFPANNTPY